MARIERADSSVPVPVERAQLQTTVQRTPFIDPSRFPFSKASAEAFKVVGGVLEELDKRSKKAQDSLSINAAGESRDLAKLEMKQFMLNNPDPDTWAEGLSKIKAGHRKRTANLRFSKEALANEQVEQKAFDDELGIGVQIQAAAQQIENDIAVSGKNRISVIGRGADAVTIARQTELYQEALERKYTKEVAAIHMEKNLGEAEKQRISVLVERKDFKGARELATATKAFIPSERVAQLAFIRQEEERLLNNAKRQKFKFDVGIRQDFTEKVRQNDLNLDDVREKYPNAETNKNQQKEVLFWQSIITNRQKEAPAKSTGKGLGVVNKTLLEVSLGIKDTKSAYNDILKARYIDKIITDTTFNWAEKRLNSPYPEPLAVMIDNILTQKAEAIKSAENSLFYTKREKKRVGDKVEEINMQLFRWIDKTIETDPSHIFTPQEINNMSAQIGVTMFKFDTDFNVAPKTKEEFYRNVGDLKSADTEEALRYYNRWKGKKWQ